MGESKAVRKGTWKLSFEGKSGYGAGNNGGPDTRWRLYNLGEDLAEAKDVSASNPEVAKDLLARYQKWEAGMIAPLWPGGASGEMGMLDDDDCPPDPAEPGEIVKEKNSKNKPRQPSL
jgi:hypothetical protein